jgi:hypothetical protein
MHVVAYALDAALLAGCVVWMVGLMSAAGWRHRVRATGARRVAFEALGMPLSPAKGDDATEGIWDEFTDALSGRGEAPLKIPRL